MLDAAVRRHVRFLDVIMSDILDSHHLPFTFTYWIMSKLGSIWNLLENRCLGKLENFPCGLTVAKTHTTSGEEATNMAREFTSW